MGLLSFAAWSELVETRAETMTVLDEVLVRPFGSMTT
jgi:hypothetical protein